MKSKKRNRMNKTQNAVNRRKRIIKDIWGNPEDHRDYVQEGRLRKRNFTCDCAMCRWERLKEKLEPKAKYMWYYENHDIDE